MSSHSTTEQNNPSPLLLTSWYVGMILCTTGLYILGSTSSDNSVTPYIVWGVLAMCIAPAKKMAASIHAHNEFKRKYEENKRRTEELRAQQSEKEKRELENRKLVAANELAKRQAIKNQSG